MKDEEEKEYVYWMAEDVYNELKVRKKIHRHSPNGKDIMYWRSDVNGLSDRDRNTIFKLYGCKG
ncbi:MAG: hypothetical protein K8F91_16005 [Candidatus Obscuribacterales bacterium]|nr:hypothetical protein [Candidatus Obscuribacterales bacterium]